MVAIESQPFLTSDAAILSKHLHGAQLDKGGEPYYLHPWRVAKLVRESNGNNYQIVAAYFHDVVEDTSATLDTLGGLGLSNHHLQLIDALTKRFAETRSNYYDRILACPEAVLVKICDMHDNLDPERLAKLSPADAARLRRKYGEGLQQLA